MHHEMASHMAAYADDLIARGVPPDEAHRRARVEFGPLEEVREECRESVGLRWPFVLARDLRYAARILRKSPAFTFTALLTLALCIGLNTAIFSVVDSMLLRQLPYPDPGRLVAIETHQQSTGEDYRGFAVTGRTLEELRGASAFEIAAFSGISAGINLVNGAHVESVSAQRVTAGYFHVLRVAPAIGREFTPTEDVRGGAAVTVLSHRLWMRLFNGDRSAVGRPVNLKGEPYTIVGVMPAGFHPPDPVDLWAPLRPSRSGEGGGTNYDVVGRLRPGATLAQADAQVALVAVDAQKSGEFDKGTKIEMHALPLQREFTKNIRTPLLVLWAAVVVVLIIGCVNIAALLLVRGAARAREIGTRMALGSGKSAVVRQLLCETVLLAFVGGAIGIVLGELGLKVLKMLAGRSVDLTDVALDGRVLLISACASILTGLIFGLVPALQTSRVDIRTALLDGGSRGIAGGGRNWIRRCLVVTEVALGLVLLVVAGLLVRTFLYLHGLNPGFDGSNVLTAGISLQDARYKTAQRVNRFFDDTLDRVRQMPGVQVAGAGLTLPYEQPLNIGFKRMDGPHPDAQGAVTNLTYITPGFFEALHARLVRGRLLADADRKETEPVAMVNEAFVREYLRDQDPIDSHISTSNANRRIVGIIGDFPQANGYGSYGPLSPAPGVFVPVSQVSDGFLQLVHVWFAPRLVIRTNGRSNANIAGVAEAVRSADPLMPVASFAAMDDVISRYMSDERFQAELLGALAALAMLLAAVGIYGLIANTVVERTRELGVRMALGSTSWQALRSVALPGVILALVGVAAGCALARACVGFVSHLVYGVRPTDPSTFVIAALALLLTAAIASLLPALRVTRLNPADTLRAE